MLTVWAIVAVLDVAVLHVLAAGTGAGRGPGRGFRSNPGFAQFDDRSDEADHESVFYDVYHAFPESESIFQITSSHRRVRRPGDQAVEQRKKTAQQLMHRATGPAVEDRGCTRHPSDPTAPARRRGISRWTSYCVAAEPKQLRRPRRAARQEGFCKRDFHLRRLRLKFDQPQTEVVFDRDKLRSQGVDLSQAGTGPLDVLGRQLCQPLQHPGTKLQSHPPG